MSEQHVALYRKYRPQTFADVVGQEQIVTLLEKTVKENKPNHAYLFCGGRGTGKTTVARIFAHLIGCNPEDIIEIDAASNRGIDEIRELRDAVRTSPFSSPYKVYIVDEAHMLTKEAANALLKTLEEPPSHVIFILATTDPEKLPATIVSRCQKILFKQPRLEVLSEHLVAIASKEGKKLSEISARIIAAHGKGSYRDALGALEQVLSVDDKTINDERVMALLGTPEKQHLLTLLEAVCEKDAKKIAKVAASLEKGSSSALGSYDDFIDTVRTGLLVRIGELTTENETLTKLATAYPLTIGSKLVLELLEKRHLIEVSNAHSWVAFEAILLSTVESE